METTHLVQSLEHTAAQLLMAAERDTVNREDMRLLAAQLQVLTTHLDQPAAR
jgi:hypothetical protein